MLEPQKRPRRGEWLNMVKIMEEFGVWMCQLSIYIYFIYRLEHVGTSPSSLGLGLMFVLPNSNQSLDVFGRSPCVKLCPLSFQHVPLCF